MWERISSAPRRPMLIAASPLPPGDLFNRWWNAPDWRVVNERGGDMQITEAMIEARLARCKREYQAGMNGHGDMDRGYRKQAENELVREVALVEAIEGLKLVPAPAGCDHAFMLNVPSLNKARERVAKWREEFEPPARSVDAIVADVEKASRDPFQPGETYRAVLRALLDELVAAAKRAQRGA